MANNKALIFIFIYFLESKYIRIRFFFKKIAFNFINAFLISFREIKLFGFFLSFFFNNRINNITIFKYLFIKRR